MVSKWLLFLSYNCWFEELIEVEEDEIKMLLVGKINVEQNNIQANISDWLESVIEVESHEYKKINKK